MYQVKYLNLTIMLLFSFSSFFICFANRRALTKYLIKTLILDKKNVLYYFFEKKKKHYLMLLKLYRKKTVNFINKYVSQFGKIVFKSFVS